MTVSKIEWTDRSDWNPIRGCTRVSPGCGGPGHAGGCYAEAMAGRFSDPGQWGHTYATRTSKGGRWTGKVELQEDRLTLPLRWKRPAKIFASSTSDVFHERLSDADIDRIFAAMALASQHTFQVLTKRADRMREYCDRKTSAIGAGAVADAIASLGGTPGDQLAFMERMAEYSCLSNVWLGVSVEDQARADERRQDFRATPAAVKFVSYEPALGPVDWRGWHFVDQIIGGGESGLKARPAHPDWFRDTRDWCVINRVAYFHKQNGEFAPGEIAGDYLDPEKPAKGLSLFDGQWSECWSEVDGHVDDEPDVYRIGKKRAGCLLDGREWNEVPAHG